MQSLMGPVLASSDDRRRGVAADAVGYGPSVITAAGIRAAIARLADSGRRPTVQNVANELHVKSIELEPLIHQMFRDGQLDPSLDTIHEPESPTGSCRSAWP
jgi:hypothetical protein